MDKVKTIIEIPIADVKGEPIYAGSVLRKIDSDTTGVVMRIIKEGDYTSMFSCIGDMEIHISPGITRVSNQYDKWIHVPKSEQTFYQRYLSWYQKPSYIDEWSEISKDEQICMEGILSILPDECINWEFDPPGNFTEALNLLANYLDKTENE